MAREVEEWVGKNDDTAIPDRVKLRILDRDGHRCVCCTRPFDAKSKPQFDHRPALVNGGQNRESKIFPVCATCHSGLTTADVAEKSAVYQKRKKHVLPKTTDQRNTPRGFRKMPPGFKFDWSVGRIVKL